MNWSILNFGKHEGKTLPQVLWNDPDWFFYLMERCAFDGRGSLESEAYDLNRKARFIAIPHNESGNLVVAYCIHRPTGMFGGVWVIPHDELSRLESSPVVTTEVFDLSVPKAIAPYDKRGNEMHIRDIKEYLFGKSNYRMNKKRCEAFFEDATNFVL